MVFRGFVRERPHGVRSEAAGGQVYRRISHLWLPKGPGRQKPYHSGSRGRRGGSPNFPMVDGGSRAAEHCLSAQPAGRAQPHPLQSRTGLDLQPPDEERFRPVEQGDGGPHPHQRDVYWGDDPGPPEKGQLQI